MSLLELPPDVDAVIAQVVAPDEEGPLLRAMGLLEGQPIRVLRRAPLGGPLQVRVGDACFAVGRSLASSVRVQVVEAR
jgi:Fe2+ transport system protein FeoA